jgi:type VI secretion system protein ImpJ
MDLAEKQDAKTKRLYKTAEVNIADENTGLNPQPIQIRRINARLLLDDDDRDDMEVMPLFHVSTPAMGAIGLPRIDPISFPPCLFLSAWEPLHSLIRAMVDEIEATRGGVAKDLLRDGFDIQSLRPAQMRQVLRLQALNRAASRLPSLVRAPRITPFQLYLELRELLGNLAISDPDGDAFECADYDHDDPALPFKDVCDRIRKYLDRQAGPSALKWELVRENRAFVGRGIPKENLELPELFLAIETHEDRAKVAQLVQDSIRFKMLPASLVNKIAQKGVRLVLDHNPPSNLPSAPGRSYFRIMRDDETSEGWWEKIKAEGAVGVTWLGMDLPDVRFTLHAMLKH